MTDALAETSPPVGRPRTAQVTAVVVTRGDSEYLEATIAALAAQTRAPQQVLLVDAGREPAGDLGRLLTARWSAGPPDPERATVVPVPRARTFGDAVRAALAPGSPGWAPTGDGRDSWLWLLHDDSAPAPTALAELLRAVEIAPSVAVAGCKQHTWTEPVRVLEVGVSTSRFGRRMTGIDVPEVDQGQHDGRDDVLAVGLAGALVRRDVWDDLGGPDPALGPYGDGLDLCRRARLAGHRVVVVPGAVVRHAQASLARPFGGAVLNRPGWDVRRSARARREAYLHSQLTGVPLLLVPAVAVLALVSGVVRALGRLVTKEPHLLLAELLAPFAVLVRPGRVVSARRRATRTRRVRRGSLRPLQVGWRDVAQQARDRRLSAAEARRTQQAPSELELRELAALRTRRRAVLVSVLLTVAVLSVATLAPVVTRVATGATLTGGALPAGDATRVDMWRAVRSWWVTSDLGHPGPVDPSLVVLLPLTALLGTAGRATAVLLLGALLLAAVGAWFAAGAVTRSVALRAWAVLVWVAAPPLLVALGEVRWGAVLAHVALPWVALGLGRGLGGARTDVVESGLVGAQREGSGTTGRPTAQQQPQAGATLGVGSGGDAARGDEAASVEEAARGDEAASVDEAAPGPGAPADQATASAVTSAATAPSSLAAAAGAGLALAVATAGAPVLLPAALLVLVAVAVASDRRRRLVWVALPALTLHGPTIAEAVGRWSDGGWRSLVADPGVPLPSPLGPAWQRLLGWPVEPGQAWPLLATVPPVVPLVATGIVLLPALVALARSGRVVGRGARLGWLTTAVGLAAATLAVRTQVGVAPGAEVLARGWPGSGVSLALAGLLGAGLLGAEAVGAEIRRRSLGWRQVTAVALAVLTVAGPAAVLGSWVWAARSSVAADGDAVLGLRTSAQSVVPAVGRQLQESPEDVRVLSVTAPEPGEVAVTLLRDDGVRLTELSRSVTTRAVQGPIGDPALAAPDDADQELREVTAAVATGTDPAVGAALARLAVGAVLVPPVGEGAPEHVVAERSALVGRLDATPGLERVTDTPSGVVWRVTTTQAATTSAWARLVDARGGAQGGSVLGAVPAQDGEVSTRVAAAEGPRLLVLAERADPGWRAWLDGRPLRAVGTEWRQAFELGADGGMLTVTYAPTERQPWQVLQLLVLLVTVLLAVPARRRRVTR